MSADRLTPQLLGRHVQRSSGQTVCIQRIRRLEGQTKIENDRTMARGLNQDVSWLDVSMDDALLVNGKQAGGDLFDHADNRLRIANRIAIVPCLKCLAVDPFHHIEDQS